MKVSALRGKKRTIQVRVPGEEGEADEFVSVTYSPGALDIEMAERMSEIALSSIADIAVVSVMLEPLLVSWDLQDEDGSPWPCDEEHLKKTPVMFLGLILSAIQEDARPNPQRPVSSENGSQQTDGPEASLSGTSSSEQPTVSVVPPGNS